MEQGPFMDLIRDFFSFLDSIIYGLMGDAYNLVEEVAHYKIFENVDFLVDKIYAILSIFMLFKVSFSFINYIVNPDSFTDKEKGVQKIITNIVIMFVMLIICPWAFNQLWGLQTAILDENVLGNFIFGTEDDKLNEYSMATEQWCAEAGLPYEMSRAATNGDYISLMVLRGFYRPYTEEDIGYNLLDEKYDTDGSEVGKKLCTSCNGSKNCGKPSTYLVSEIYNADADVDGWSFPILGSDTDIYIMQYRWGVSTAVGVVVLLLLVSFAMDVGLRVVKLSFLELIAPIPIVSYIDPASGKNGMFKKWLKEVGSTWASIFIRLLGLFFAVRIIQEVGSLTWIGAGPAQEASIWVEIFVIIGALMFAKQLPKLIQNITGINFDGGFSINPLKKVREQAIGGKLVTGATTGVVAGGLALAGGAAANVWSAHKNNAKIKSELAKDGITSEDPRFKQEFKARGGRTGIGYVPTMVAGGLSSAGRAVVKGKDGTWHPLKNAASGITDSSARRNQRNDKIGTIERTRGKITSIAGVKNDYGLYNENDTRIKELTNREAEYNTREEIARKAQTEFEAATGYMADTFVEGFRRDPEGLGIRKFDIKDQNGNYKYSGNSEFERYKLYMAELNKNRKDGEKVSELDETTFNNYARLEYNSHYYNQQHEAIKKDLSKQKKLFEKQDKKG